MFEVVQHITTLIDSPQVRVAEFMMSPNSKAERHYHSSTNEFCVCLEGRLIVECDGGTGVVLSAGQWIEIQSQVVHRLSNPEDSTSRYMVVQGIGQYDFIPVHTTP